MCQQIRYMLFTVEKLSEPQNYKVLSKMKFSKTLKTDLNAKDLRSKVNKFSLKTAWRVTSEVTLNKFYESMNRQQ